MLRAFSKSFVTLFGLGYFPKAPGTIASIVGIILGGVILALDNGLIYLILLLLIVGIVGTLCLNASISSFNSKDPSEVVIDELIGQWVALWPLALFKFILESGFLLPYPVKFYLSFEPVLQHLGLGISDLIPVEWYYFLSLLALFILFRFFDIKKPLIIGRIDKQNTPFSIMLDDIYAGLFAGTVFLTLILLIYILS